ncbi:MAG TPA: hypothetical protein VMW23_04835, partial [Sedimentisphaerales bacterium]|nr:hypothetical protein [Sedimentisphaerales bacterium]
MKKAKTTACRFGRIYLHILPVLVWVAAVAGVVVLFRHRSQRFEISGIAQGRIHQVSAAVDCRLKVVSVELFEKVSKGQTLAALDDTELNAQIAAIDAEIEHLRSQLVSTEDAMLAEATNLETDRVAAQRRFDVDVENARLRIMELQTLIETDKITLEDLAVDVKIATQLLQKDAIAPYDLQKAQAVYNALAKKVEENGHLLAQAQHYFAQAQQRRDEFVQRLPAHPSVDNALEIIRRQIIVQEKLIDQLAVQRQALRITSPAEGVVIQIQVVTNRAALRRAGEDVLRRSGEVVLAGDPILVVAETEPTDIIAYVGQELSGKIKERMVVQLVKSTEPAQITSSQVVRVSPAMELMPQQLWRNPNVTQWGRPILIKIPPG